MSTKVYQAINSVQAMLSRDGIEKKGKNQQQGYAFRGIDDVLNALSTFLATEKLCILPRVLSREVVERQTKSGGALFYVTVHVEYDLVSTEDGSKHTVSTYGEAMDSADKATNKAMSAAYKYMAIQSFAIPTIGDNDADSTTYEVAAQPKKTSPTDLAKAQQEALDAENNRLASMDLLLENMQAAADIESLKKPYTARYKLCNGDSEREQTKREYDGLKAKITTTEGK
jgi:hypothetical protein